MPLVLVYTFAGHSLTVPLRWFLVVAVPIVWRFGYVLGQSLMDHLLPPS